MTADARTGQVRCAYDGMGRLVYFRGIDGTETRWEYCDSGTRSHATHPNGLQVWREYNSSGGLAHELKSNGDESWLEYDASNRLVFIRANDGKAWHVDPLAGTITRL